MAVPFPRKASTPPTLDVGEYSEVDADAGEVEVLASPCAYSSISILNTARGLATRRARRPWSVAAESDVLGLGLLEGTRSYEVSD